MHIHIYGYAYTVMHIDIQYTCDYKNAGNESYSSIYFGISPRIIFLCDFHGLLLFSFRILANFLLIMFASLM